MAAAAQAPQPPATPNATNSIAIDLNAASQTGRVNFDVPIVLQVAIQNDVTDVEVFEVESRSKSACNSKTAFPAVAVNSWHRFDLGRAPDAGQAAAGTTTANITVDPVDANRYLCFKFSVTRTLTAAEIKTFTDSAISEADIRLRGELLRRDGFTGDQVEELRKALRVAAGIDQPAAGSGLRREVKPGSMLSSDPTAEARNEFTSWLGGIFAATLNRKSILDDLNAPNGQVDAAARALAAAAVNPLLNRLRGKNPSVDLLLTIVGASSDLTTGRARSAAIGLPPDVADTKPLNRMWDTTEVDPRLKVVRDWIATVSAVQTFVAGASADIVAPPIADADRAALVLQLANARAALDPVGSAIGGLRDALALRHDALVAFAATIGTRVSADAFVGTSSFADFNTRSTWYLSADIGLGFAPRLKSAFPYAGGNIYFRPVNKEAPLSLRGSFGRRFSAMVGASFSTDLEKPGQIANSLGTRMLLIGVGFRLTDILRAGAGAVVVKALDPNPLLTGDLGVQLTPFFSLSIDWDAKTTFQRVFNESNK